VVQELKDAHLRIRGGVHDNEDQVQVLDDHQGVTKVQLNQEGLVVPRKLSNPCKESRELKSLHREIRWNAKA
jgi:hypothetical protein